MRLILLCLWGLSLNCSAQVVQNFSLLNAIDGKTVSLQDFSSSSGVIIIFSSHNCPYDGYYRNRIKELAESYNAKTPLLLINSNPEESIDQMRSYAEQRKLSVPYLADKDQKVLASLNPRKSPECFLLKNSGGKFTIIYRGAIDDNAQTAAAVTHTYLKDAINKLLAGDKIEVSDVRPVGCSIRKN
jgi:peroxiredoxin